MSDIWAAQWNSLDRKHLLREKCLPVLFKTKRECSEWIKKNYGYIATRKDLRAAPHHWRVPKPVRVLVFEITHLQQLKKANTP